MLDLIIASDILALMKLHISEYSRFKLLLSREARRRCAATTPAPGIMSTDYTIGVKERPLFRKIWRYLSFLSFSAIAKAFTDV